LSALLTKGYRSAVSRGDRGVDTAAGRAAGRTGDEGWLNGAAGPTTTGPTTTGPGHSKDEMRWLFAPIARVAKHVRGNPRAMDTLIAAVVTGTSLVGLMAHLHVDLPEGGEDEVLRQLDALGVGLALLQTVPLIWRRSAPVLVLAVTTGALFLFSLLGYFHSFASFGFLLALYTVAAHRERRISVRAGIASGAVMLLILLLGKEPLEPDEIIIECLILGAAWFLGDSLRIQRRQVVRLEDRATRFEREREEFAQQAVAQERRVIARELHDVVAHNVSVIVAQAGAAQRVIDIQPEEAVPTLSTIEDTGRAALVEMRRLMGFLRTEADDSVMRSPQPGLYNLEALVSQVREAGLLVTLRIEGVPRVLPAGLDLSAFRIVQEALTNILKHAGRARADVVVRYEERRVHLTIDDDGVGSDGWSDGEPQPRYGHLGMGERVALFGGELRVGPKPHGGYRVVAILALDEEGP
jgi:signal transduction histidine kinase